MEVIRRVPPTCNCHERLERFAEAERAAGRLLAIGSEVRCDCGALHQLRDHQFDGPYWQHQVRR